MDSGKIKKRLKLAVYLTSFVLFIEIAGGLMANSLALLSDAAHMFTDVFSLTLSLFALNIAAKPFTSAKTYGYHRVEIFAALGNGILLFLMACGIFYEALHRLIDPGEVNFQILIVVATAGLLTNLGVLYFLKDTVKHNQDLNIKSALFHVIGDSAASVGVILGGAIMWLTQWYIVDAILAAAISVFLLWVAKNIIGDAFHILLEGAPKGVSVQEVKHALKSIPAVKDIHELHVWCICSNIYALSAHALVNDQRVNQVESVLQEIKTTLKTRFNITHSTVQFETSLCGDSESFCDIKH